MDRMRYFRLAADCLLVEGENGGAIYDIHGCRLFLLDDQAHNLLRKCERNELLGDQLGESETLFLEELQDKGIGFFDFKPAYVDKFLLHQPIKFKGMITQPPEFFRVDWAITNECDLKCNFCGRADETLSWRACQTCLRHDKGLENEWIPSSCENFINTIDSLGVKVLHIRGGNPLLRLNHLQQIVQSVRYTSLDLVITTPGTCVDIKKLIDLCEGGRARINIVMFGLNSGVVDQVCACNGVLRQQMALIGALTEARLPFLVTILLSQSSLFQRQQALEFIRNCNLAGYSAGEIHFINAMGKGFRLSHVGEDTRPLNPWQSVEDFYSRLQFNSCMNGRFEISCDGKLRPCAGNHRVLGDIVDGGLRTALARTDLYDIWERNKGSVLPCRYCELRYACADCSAFEFKGEDNLIIKEAYCPHQPSRYAPKAYRKNWSSEGFIWTLRMLDS
jgi:MoaA/NifB/PqqE/SkfB family radical SAM enzyme